MLFCLCVLSYFVVLSNLKSTPVLLSQPAHMLSCCCPLLVQFNRCVTSQMIKWFSNFREFFYIQMERFARQAVREALTRLVWIFVFSTQCFTDWFDTPAWVETAQPLNTDSFTMQSIVHHVLLYIAMLYNGQHSLCFLRHVVKNDHVAVCVVPRDGGARLGRESQLRVGRDSELYRILNMHYNKSNVYQVRWLHQCTPCFTHYILKLQSGEGWIFLLIIF